MKLQHREYEILGASKDFEPNFQSRLNFFDPTPGVFGLSLSGSDIVRAQLIEDLENETGADSLG